MTGPEHYREAERLISLEPLQRTESGELDAPAVAALMAEAQVHATLALAAATAAGIEKWQKVTR